MKIINLKQKPEYLQILAEWHQQEWSHFNPGQSLSGRIDKMQAYLNDEFIPTTFVAENEKLLGSAAIIKCDMEERKQFSPWLASVYVAPEFRGQGIASELVRHAMAQAFKQGVEKLYLYTPDQQLFYKKLGWLTEERLSYHQEDVTIMSVILKS